MWKNLLAAFTAAELQRRGQFKGKDLYIKMHEILLEQLEVFFKIFKKDLGMIPNGLTPETILSRTLPASAKSGSRKKIVSTPADEESMMLKVSGCFNPLSVFEYANFHNIIRILWTQKHLEKLGGVNTRDV